MRKEILNACGINYDSGSRRFMGDNELYEEMLKVFLSDETFANASAALEKADYEALFDQIHALKGTSGNLDMTDLYAAASDLTEYLRHNDSPDSKQVINSFEKIRTAYQRVIDGIISASK